MSQTTEPMNCGITFLSDNLVLDAELSLTTGSENIQFPLKNLQNVSTARKFRSDGNDVVIVIDLQQTRSFNAIAVMGDATGQFGITNMSFKTSVTTDFSMSTAQTIPYNASQNMGYLFFTTEARRYVEITFTGSGSFVEVGAIFLAERIELPQNNLSTGSFKYINRDPSKVSKNRYSQRFIDELPLVKMLSGALQYCTVEEQFELDELFIKHGIHEPLFMVVDQDGAGMTEGQYKLSIYGYITKTPQWSASGGQLWNTSIEVEEAI